MFNFLPKWKLRHAVELGQETTFLLGNNTLAGQVLDGIYTLSEKTCSFVDGVTCTIPDISLCYYAGGTLQIAGGVCLVASGVSGFVFTPLALSVAGTG